MFAFAASVVTALVVLTGCSGAVVVNGLDLSNDEEVANKGMELFRSQLAPAVQSGATTIHKDANCFFVKTAPDSEEVGSTLACGPTRRLGRPIEAAWSTYQLSITQDAKGKAVAEVAEPIGWSEVLDPQLLVSPTGATPADPGSVPEPTAPPASVSDVALAGDQSFLDAEFAPLKEPWRLITPSTNLEVVATAEPEYVPAILETGGPSESDVPYFRPADGQRVVALKIRVAPSSGTAMPQVESFWGSDEQVVALDTVVSLQVGDKRVPIKDFRPKENSGYEEEPADTVTITCRTLPCEETSTTEFVVIASVPAEGPTSLTALVNGGSQALDLGSGKRSTSVSSVDYDRPDRVVDLNKSLSTELHQDAQYSDDGYTCHWTVKTTQARLGAFDPYKGWAKEGKAWLSVGLDGFDRSGECSAFDENDKATEVHLTVGKNKIKPVRVADNASVFEVPGDVTSATFSYTPQGTYVGGVHNRDFAADAATVTLEMKK
ncbi:hypothetical protein ACQCX2_14275 [Propionibacteriaceae bacterium Y1700]|uniref:hypothetical protein n=1 Tax=Microlunatus sp. Y1700 TaxID=3418487 RepID=UPI003DA6D7ED